MRGEIASRTTKALLTLGCAVILVASPPLDATGRAGHRVITGSFTAEAPPLPRPSIWLLEGYCLGERGIDLVSKRFEAPWDGGLIAAISSPVRGWNLAISAVTGPESYYNYTMASTGDTTSQVSLRDGEDIDIVPCNYRGLPGAEVNYEFRHRPYPQRPPTTGGRMSRLFVGTYYTPAVATVVPGRHAVACIAQVGTGCVGTEVKSGERFIKNVEVTDLASDEVSVIVYQLASRTGGSHQDYVCTKLDELIELIPNADWVGVTVVVGPCIDGTPAMATTGKVRIVFAPRPH